MIRTLLTWVGLIFHKRSDGMMLKQIYKQINTFTKLTYFNNKNNNSWISNFTFLKCRTHLLELGAQMRLTFGWNSVYIVTYIVYIYGLVMMYICTALYKKGGGEIRVNWTRTVAQQRPAESWSETFFIFVVKEAAIRYNCMK